MAQPLLVDDLDEPDAPPVQPVGLIVDDLDQPDAPAAAAAPLILDDLDDAPAAPAPPSLAGLLLQATQGPQGLVDAATAAASNPRGLAATGARVGGQMLGAAGGALGVGALTGGTGAYPGGLAGAGLGAAAVEPLAQMIEGRPVNLAESIPAGLAGLAGAAIPGSTIPRQALSSAVFGGLEDAGRAVARGEDVDLAQAGRSAIDSALFGAGFAAGAKALGGAAPVIVDDIDAPTIIDDFDLQGAPPPVPDMAPRRPFYDQPEPLPPAGPPGERRLYHGTGADFDSLRLDRADPNALYGPGIYATSSPRIAEGYAAAGAAPNIRPVQLGGERWLDMDAPPPPELVAAVQGMPRPTSSDRDWSVPPQTADDLHADLAEVLGSQRAANQWLVQQGYSGLTHVGGRNTGQPPHRVWIALQSTDGRMEGPGAGRPSEWPREGAAVPLAAAMPGEGPRTLADLFPELGTAAAPESPSLLSRFARAGQNQPDQIPDGPLSAADPDALAPSFAQGLDERLAGMNQWLAEGARPDVAGARRGRVSFEQTAEEATALRREIEGYAAQTGRSTEEIDAELRRHGEGANAAQVVYLRQRNEEATANAIEAGRRALEDPTPENAAAAKLAVAHVAATIGNRAGALAEAGRAVGAARIQPGPAAVVQRAIENMNKMGEEQLRGLFALLAKTDDPKAVNSYVAQVSPAKFWDKAHEAWLSLMLTGPQTHAKNTLSSVINAGLRPTERVLAGGLDAARSAVTGAPRQRYVGEALRDLVGQVRALPAAKRAAGEAWRTETPSEGASKLIDAGANRQAIKGTTGRVIRTPLRALLAADEFWKTVTRGGEREALALRVAKQEGLSGDALVARRRELAANPTEAMRDAENVAARYWTFQQEMGEWGRWLSEGRRKIPTLRWVAPFLQTPVNVTKFGLERTPAAWGYLAKELRSGRMTSGELEDQAARAILGSLVAGAVGKLWWDEQITGGGPTDPARRRTWMQTHKPYSVKLGDRWVSYSPVEPLGMTFGLIADAVEIGHQSAKQGDYANLPLAVGQSVAVNLSNKTFMQGLSNAIEAATDSEPDRAQRFLTQMAGSFIPGASGQLARAFDPTLRKPRTLGEVFQSRVPGLTEGAPAVRDMWGRPIKREGVAFDDRNIMLATLERAVSPFTSSPVSTDPASIEVDRHEIGYADPPRYFTVGGKRVLYPPEAYEQLRIEAGEAAKRAVDRLVAGAAYQRAPFERQTELLRRTIEAAKAGPRERIQAGVIREQRASR